MVALSNIQRVVLNKIERASVAATWLEVLDFGEKNTVSSLERRGLVVGARTTESRAGQRVWLVRTPRPTSRHAELEAMRAGLRAWNRVVIEQLAAVELGPLEETDLPLLMRLGWALAYSSALGAERCG